MANSMEKELSTFTERWDEHTAKTMALIVGSYLIMHIKFYENRIQNRF